MVDKKATDYFASIIDDDLKHRKNNNHSRPDIMQIFLESGMKSRVHVCVPLFESILLFVFPRCP